MKTLEAQEQEALFKWTEIQKNKYPELELMYHIPNGGKRDIRTAMAMKRQGVKPGVPDIFLPVARYEFHGLYIELKAGKGKPSEKQKEWINKLTEQNYLVVICYGWEEAAKVILEYLG